MAKQTITEYETKEETYKRIQCDDCDETWEKRGEDSHNSVILNARIEESRYNGRWRAQDFESKLYSSSTYRLGGDAIADYCDTCWSKKFPESSMIEVTETDYHVEEKKREEYFCDFCEQEMGEDPDNEVRRNARIIHTRRLGTAPRSITDTHKTTEARSLGGTFSVGRKGEANGVDDSSHDCCQSCATEMFDLSSNEPSESMLRRFVRVLPGM